MATLCLSSGKLLYYSSGAIKFSPSCVNALLSKENIQESLADPQCLSKVEGERNGCASMHQAEEAHVISFEIIVLPNLETFCMP